MIFPIETACFLTFKKYLSIRLLDTYYSPWFASQLIQ